MAKQVKPATPEPVITFVEEDVKLLQQFGQLLVSKATLNLSIQDAMNLTKYISHMNSITRKIEAHILEVKRITQLKDSSDADKL
jgi:hypothetical protein